MSERKLYKPFVSEAKNKKYSVYVMRDGKRRLIHFGDKRYGQYRDKLGVYASQDHLRRFRSILKSFDKRSRQVPLSSPKRRTLSKSRRRQLLSSRPGSS